MEVITITVEGKRDSGVSTVATQIRDFLFSLYYYPPCLIEESSVQGENKVTITIADRHQRDRSEGKEAFIKRNGFSGDH